MNRFEPHPVDQPPAAGLVTAMVDEMEALYGNERGGMQGGVIPSGLEPPDGVFLVGWQGDEAVAGGGLRRLGDDLAEVKRMYVVPAWRGRGVARLLLTALEDAALERGYRRVRLDTGPMQPAADHLYTTTGYRSIPDYNDNAHASFWGEKAL